MTFAVGLAACGSASAPRRDAADAKTVSDAGADVADTVADQVAAEVPAAPSLFEMIDDMDHVAHPLALPPDSSAFAWHGGIGYWFVSGQISPIAHAKIESIVPPRGSSRKAIHVSGSNLAKGIALWAQLDHPQFRAADLSAYVGVAFWARLDSTSRRLTTSLENAPASPLDDNRRQSTRLVRTLSDSGWERVVLLFEDFAPGGVAGDAGASDAGDAGAGAPRTSSVFSIAFLVGAGGEAFDLWIDDLSLICRGTCPAH